MPTICCFNQYFPYKVGYKPFLILYQQMFETKKQQYFSHCISTVFVLCLCEWLEISQLTRFLISLVQSEHTRLIRNVSLHVSVDNLQ